jgi:hypothetical protein
LRRRTAAKAPPKVTIKLENTIDDVVVADIRIRDLLDNPYSEFDISLLKSKEISDLSNQRFVRDKDGKFDISIRYLCWKGGDGRKPLSSPGIEEYKVRKPHFRSLKPKSKTKKTKKTNAD